MKRYPIFIDNLQQATSHILEKVGPQLKIATPLGLGKPNRLLNVIYNEVKNQPETLSLQLYTALSLQVPTGKSDLEKRFLGPFTARHFGTDYPALDYLTDVMSEQLPDNVVVHEFYFSSGTQLYNGPAQRHYISQNYTHVARDLAERSVNVLLQQVAKRGDRYSLASNSDVALDLKDLMDDCGKPFYVVAVVNESMPFLDGDANVAADCFDMIINDGQSERLFGIPREAVGNAEHAIGLLASTLVKDSGSIQIGIGALSDALVNALIMRHQHNQLYLSATEAFSISEQDPLTGKYGGLKPFKQGLFGATEMVMDGFMHLHRAGILSRIAYDDVQLQRLLDEQQLSNPLDEQALNQLLDNHILPLKLDANAIVWLEKFGLLDGKGEIQGRYFYCADGSRFATDLSKQKNRKIFSEYLTGKKLTGGRYLEGAFFLGSSELYQWLRELKGEPWQGLAMQRVSQINQLYGEKEKLERQQRKDGRFFNTCMMHTLMGAAVSDGLENGQVVSGVGGQYNFVAMAHALHEGRSIIMLRSTRTKKGVSTSNILWNYGHVTIPRHLRDIVITEYGIADLRGQCDEDIIKRLLAITDSRFQQSLMETAQSAGKLAPDFTLPASWKNNTPQLLANRLSSFKQQGEFKKYPFGSDFDEVEQQLIQALSQLKNATATPIKKLITLLSVLKPLAKDEGIEKCLQRMGLASPLTLTEKIQQRLIHRFLK